LQGGDYDGDTFWITWDERLCEPFKNAPAPLESPKPSDFCIRTDRRTLGDVLGPTLNDVDNWLSESFRFCMQEDMLGQVTNYHKRLAYHDKSLATRGVNIVADVHHLIIDSAKSGYSFDQGDFKQVLRDYNLTAQLEMPLYENYTTLLGDSTATMERQRLCKAYSTLRKRHIVDAIMFEKVVPAVDSFRQEFHRLLQDAEDFDAQLERPYLDARERSVDAILIRILDRLDKDVVDVTRQWGNGVAQYLNFKTRNNDAWTQTIMPKLLVKYSAILPVTSKHPVVHEWLHKDAPFAFSRWELIRASALVHFRQSRTSESKARLRMAFLLAGRELCAIKAQSMPSAHALCSDMWSMYRPRKMRKTVAARLSFQDATDRDVDTAEDTESDER